MKEFIKSMKLRWTDLAFVVGLIPFAVLLLFGTHYMQYPNPDDVALPLWGGILCFVFLLGCWGYYIYEEVWKKKDELNKFHLIVVAVLATIVLVNIITILIQPEYHVENVIIRYSEADPSLIGDNVPLVLRVSLTHKIHFIFEVIASAMCIYIGLFVLPKRFTSISFIRYLGYALFIFLGILIIYGYIAEFKNYIGFFKYALGIDRPVDKSIYSFAVQSFILHRNAYGMMMMVGVIFAFICHELHQKWYYYLFAGIFYINMIFSLCKTGLLISAIVILVYVFYRLIITYKEHKNRNKTLIICFVSLLGALFIIGGISYLSKGKFLSPIYNAIQSLTGGGQSLDTRSYIWDNSYQLMHSGWWILGRGFGTFNTMLMPMNIATHEDPVFPSHSSYIGLLAEGGVLFLFAYLALMVYAGYVIYKSFKKQPGLTLAVALGVFSFVMYSFIETIHYFVYVFLFPIMVIYYLKPKENQKNE